MEKVQLDFVALLDVLDKQTVGQLRKAVNAALDQSLTQERWYLSDLECLKFIDKTYKGGLVQWLRNI